MSERGERERLPDEREGLTQRFMIGDVKGYVTVSFYEDGRVGEIFTKMAKQGSVVSGFLDAWAVSVSMLLQTGTPLEKIVEKFRGTRFEPAGMTDDPNIRIVTSPLDYIARWLERRFIKTSLDDS